MKFHSMKRSLALAGAICLAVTSSVLANPAAPTGLQAPQLSTTEDGATLIGSARARPRTSIVITSTWMAS